MAERARSRCDVQPWQTSQPASFNLLRGRPSSPGASLDPNRPRLGSFLIRGTDVVASFADSPYAAEATLKVAFAWAAHQQGGLLVHSGAFAWQGIGGVLVLGPSGAGKSTLSRLVVNDGAVLLSDETNLLLPARELAGTPFRSDAGLEPSPSVVRLAAVLTLTHGPREGWRPLPVHHVVGRALAQAYRLGASVAPQQALLDRTAALLEGVPAFDFTFRKDAAAASWLREALGSLR